MVDNLDFLFISLHIYERISPGGATSQSLKVSMTLEDIVLLKLIIITNFSSISVVLSIKICMNFNYIYTF